MNENKDCLFCLLDKPKTKKHITPCECRPYLHQRCVNIWYMNTPNECPICRINYEDIGIIKEDDNSIDIIEQQIYINQIRVKNCVILVFVSSFTLLCKFMIFG